MKFSKSIQKFSQLKANFPQVRLRFRHLFIYQSSENDYLNKMSVIHANGFIPTNFSIKQPKSKEQIQPKTIDKIIIDDIENDYLFSMSNKQAIVGDPILLKKYY